MVEIRCLKKQILLLIVCTTSTILLAQTPEVDNNGVAELSKRSAFNQVNVAIGASTMGIGLELATPINEYISLRAGYSRLAHTMSRDISIEDDAMRQLLGYDPIYKAHATGSMGHGRMLFDFMLVPRGFFAFTTGVFVGRTSIVSDGMLVNPADGSLARLPNGADWPVIPFGDYRLKISQQGGLPMELHLGNTIKPYLGITLGRAVTNNRIGFKCDLGIMYQGKYTLYQYGEKISQAAIEAKSGTDFVDINKVLDHLRWWPMVNFQMSMKLF